MHGVHHTIDLGSIVEKVGRDPEGKGGFWIIHVQAKLGRADHIPHLLLQAADKLLNLVLVISVREGIERGEAGGELRYVRGEEYRTIAEGLPYPRLEIGTQAADMGFNAIAADLLPQVAGIEQGLEGRIVIPAAVREHAGNVFNP